MGTRTEYLPQPVSARVVKDFHTTYRVGDVLQIDRLIGTMAGPVKSNQFIPMMHLHEEDRTRINQMLTPASKT